MDRNDTVIKKQKNTPLGRLHVWKSDEGHVPLQSVPGDIRRGRHAAGHAWVKALARERGAVSLEAERERGRPRTGPALTWRSSLAVRIHGDLVVVVVLVEVSRGIHALLPRGPSVLSVGRLEETEGLSAAPPLPHPPASASA